MKSTPETPCKPRQPKKSISFELDFRMPLPPPPSDAFSITGKPMRWAQRKASATEKRQAFLEAGFRLAWGNKHDLDVA